MLEPGEVVLYQGIGGADDRHRTIDLAVLRTLLVLGCRHRPGADRVGNHPLELVAEVHRKGLENDFKAFFVYTWVLWFNQVGVTQEAVASRSQIVLGSTFMIL